MLLLVWEDVLGGRVDDEEDENDGGGRGWGGPPRRCVMYRALR